MSDISRDDFSADVVRRVGERVAHICSNPGCRKPAIGPHSDPCKSLKTGKACHIRAAAPGGPRYDGTQSPEDRRSIQNAIWLCSSCSDLVDKDEKKFPAQLLRDWKNEQEEWVSKGGFIPQLPEITLKSHAGLTAPLEGEMTLQAGDDRREHSLTIKNVANSKLTMLAARLQLPEQAVQGGLLHCPVGVQVSFLADIPQMMLSGSPGATVRVDKPRPAMNFELQIDQLPPGQHIEIGLRTSRGAYWGPTFGEGIWADRPGDPPTIFHFIKGSFQFDYQGAVLSREMIARLNYDKDSRNMSFDPVVGALTDCRVMMASQGGGITISTGPLKKPADDTGQ